MKTLFSLSVLAVLVAVFPSPCIAMISFGYVTKDQAKELGMQIRSKAAGPDAVWVEFEFKTEGRLKGFREPKSHNRVELRVSEGEKKSLVTAALREDRSKPGRVAVSFTADRANLDRMTLWVIQYIDGTAKVLRLGDFIEVDKLGVPEHPPGPKAKKPRPDRAAPASGSETQDPSKSKKSTNQTPPDPDVHGQSKVEFLIRYWLVARAPPV